MNAKIKLKIGLEIRGHIRSAEAIALRCSVKKVFLEILQNIQENTCARVSVLLY